MDEPKTDGPKTTRILLTLPADAMAKIMALPDAELAALGIARITKFDDLSAYDQAAWYERIVDLGASQPPDSDLPDAGADPMGSTCTRQRINIPKEIP